MFAFGWSSLTTATITQMLVLNNDMGFYNKLKVTLVVKFDLGHHQPKQSTFITFFLDFHMFWLQNYTNC